MNNAETQQAVNLLRKNLEESANPNMRLAIKGQAPVAALVYGLAYLDTLAGFFYGSDAKTQVKKLGLRGDGVGTRYEKYLGEYLSPARSGCDYVPIDLYASLRCNMLHSLMSGHAKKGKYIFVLDQGVADRHGSITGNRVVFDVPTFCDDILHAARTFLDDVEKSIPEVPESALVRNFKDWWENGYSILVSS